MKKRPPVLHPEWDILFPLLISKWRKIMKLPIGPEDRLQTREFQSVVQHLLEHKDNKDLSSKESLGAYLLYSWPLHYAEALSLLRELPSQPKRALELGAAGAPFSLAALQYGATEVFAIDENEKALHQGADLCGHLGYTISCRTSAITQVRSLPISGQWDLITLPYNLFYIFPSLSEQLSYIQKLLDLLSDEGHLLLIESSEPTTNQRFLALRNAIAELQIPIKAPCLWKGRCPALEHNSFCYAQRPLDKPFMIKELQRASQINLSSLKMSYLLLGAPKTPTLPRQDNLYRVVSPPVNTYKGTRFFLCGVQGQKTLGSLLQEHPKQSRAFAYLKRGDVIAIADPVELDGDLQVNEKTRLELIAPFDKPVPP